MNMLNHLNHVLLHFLHQVHLHHLRLMLVCSVLSTDHVEGIHFWAQLPSNLLLEFCVPCRKLSFQWRCHFLKLSSCVCETFSSYWAFNSFVLICPSKTFICAVSASSRFVFTHSWNRCTLNFSSMSLLAGICNYVHCCRTVQYLPYEVFVSTTCDFELRISYIKSKTSIFINLSGARHLRSDCASFLNLRRDGSIILLDFYWWGFKF